MAAVSWKIRRRYEGHASSGTTIGTGVIPSSVSYGLGAGATSLPQGPPPSYYQATATSAFAASPAPPLAAYPLSGQ
jgi:hypothetical protein